VNNSYRPQSNGRRGPLACGVVALNLDETAAIRPLPRPDDHPERPAATDAPISSPAPRRISAPATATPWCWRRRAAAQDMEFVPSSNPNRRLRRRRPDHRRLARPRAAILPLEGERFWAANAPSRQGFASRDVVSARLTTEIRRAAASVRRRTISSCQPRPSRSAGAAHEAPARHLGIGPHLRRASTVTPASDPGARRRALQHGRHPDNYHGEVLTKKNGSDDPWVRPVALGEAAACRCTAQTGSGSNSLIDLCGVRPRRRAALRERSRPATSSRELPKDSARASPRSP